MGKIFAAYSPTGGTEGSLDYLDGDSLTNTDLAIIINPTLGLLGYILIDPSSEVEDGVNVINPLTNPGTKQWILQPISGFIISGSVPNDSIKKSLDLEFMKINFQNISWAQFAAFDSFSDETKRFSPDPSTYPARVYLDSIDNGGDTTADREFGFLSKLYTNITTIETGTSTSVGEQWLQDTNKAWFTDQCKNLTLVDSSDTEFLIISNNGNTLTLEAESGTPSAGAYSIKDSNPTASVVFATYTDSSNGGYGYVKIEVSFNGGIYYYTYLDTENTINMLESTVSISEVNTGNDYIIKITLKNDALGRGSIVNKFLVCTDPSPWRF